MRPQEEQKPREISSFIEAEQPSMRFTKNVMDAIEGMQVAPVAKRYVTGWVVKGIAAMLVGAVLVLTVYAYINADAIPAIDMKGNLPINITDNSTAYIIGVNILLLLAFAERWISGRKRINALEKNA